MNQTPVLHPPWHVSTPEHNCVAHQSAACCASAWANWILLKSGIAMVYSNIWYNMIWYIYEYRWIYSINPIDIYTYLYIYIEDELFNIDIYIYIYINLIVDPSPLHLGLIATWGQKIISLCMWHWASASGNRTSHSADHIEKPSRPTATIATIIIYGFKSATRCKNIMNVFTKKRHSNRHQDGMDALPQMSMPFRFKPSSAQHLGFWRLRKACSPRREAFIHHCLRISISWYNQWYIQWLGGIWYQRASNGVLKVNGIVMVYSNNLSMVVVNLLLNPIFSDYI